MCTDGTGLQLLCCAYSDVLSLYFGRADGLGFRRDQERERERWELDCDMQLCVQYDMISDWGTRVHDIGVMIWFISNLLQSDQNDTLQEHIYPHLNPLHLTRKDATYYQRNHVEYSITIHILLRHYLDSQAPHYPTPAFGHPLIGKRVHRHIAVLWNNIWMKQQASTGHGTYLA